MVDGAKLCIEGIDTELGIANCGGRECYIEVLDMFRAEGRQKAVNMRREYAERDAKEFAVNVHGMKSILLSIGAELSVAAIRLNRAAKDGDYHTMWEGGEEFIAGCEKLIDAIDAAFA